VQRVTGIGGVFLRGRDPEALRAWYEANLGIAVEEWGGHVFTAEQGDSTVWSIFQGDTEYWPRQQQVMVNYRVDDLDAMLAQLRAAGAEVDDKVEELEFGRFGWAVDPEGNRFELWQPLQVVESSG
jgi:predicted enzyme related to lactoylglutathione lyase